MKHHIAMLLASALLVGPSAGQAASQISRAVWGAGGGTASGATTTVRTTVGQPVVGSAAGPTVGIGAGWWRHLPGTPSGLPLELDVPLTFRSYPNHPNPFNPRTTLAFDLPEATDRVRLRLYDLQGRLVANLVDGPLPAGRHDVPWQGTDDAGRTVASGVYISVLETPLGRALGKLTLVR